MNPEEKDKLLTELKRYIGESIDLSKDFSDEEIRESYQMRYLKDQKNYISVSAKKKNNRCYFQLNEKA
jgi:hypothetical protein